MAKKKLELEQPEEDKIDQIYAEITKEFGQGIISTANTFLDEKRTVIPVSPALDIALSGGIPEGSWVTLTGPPKFGKAQPLDAIVFTPDGPKKIGDLKIGDYISTPNGSFANIVAIYPQGIKDVYEVKFRDGDVAYCCDEHLWQVKCRYHKENRVLTTKEISNDLMVEPDRPKWSVKLAKCFFKKRSILIDPYMLGLLIGDGSFRGSGIKFTTTSEYFINYFKDNLIDDYELKQYPKDKLIDYSIVKSSQATIINGHYYIQALRHYKLWGHKSISKFIPDDYKFNTFENRLAIIQGLMDTDGTVSKRGQPIYYTSSLKLAEDFKYLIQSIGGLCVIRDKYTNCNGKKFKSYTCTVRIDDPRVLFRLPSKKNKTKLRSKPSVKRYINEIKKVDRKECVCIRLSSEDGLYLTNNYIVTHNSSLALWIAYKAQQLEFGSRDIYYLDIEGRLKEMNIEGLPLLNKDKFFPIRSIEGKILSAHEFLSIAEKIICSKPRSVVILDSVSALCTETELNAGMDEQQRADGPKLLAKFCRKMANRIPINKTIVIAVTHLVANVSGYGSPLQEKSGYAIAYQVDVKLRAKKREYIESKVSKKPVGQMVTWVVETSALGAPGGVAESYIRYGHGIDELSELISLGTELGLINAAGAWYSCPFIAEYVVDYNEKDFKFQGQERLYEYFKSNPDKTQYLQTAFNKLVA